MEVLKFENIFIQKGDRIVLENISFTVNSDENWVIIGENGSGKSTLIDAIAGKIFPLKGIIQKPKYSEIELIPRDFSFHRIVGQAYQYYQQRFNSFDAEIAPTVLEILQNQVKPLGTVDDKSVALPPPLYTTEEIENTAKLLKISHLLDRRIVTLSNGETRRVLITISLLKKPKLLLLDNPFTGLDIESRKTLHEVIKHISENGTKIIMVCSANEIPANTTHVLELKEGKIYKFHSKPFDSIKKSINWKGLKESETLSKIKQIPQIVDFDYALRMRNIVVTYQNKNVVDGVNWEVKRGEKWALLGPNGSGKSTILSLITADNPQGYQNDYELFDKKRGSGESIWDIKKRIGYVSPELHLYFTRNTEVWKAVGSGFFDSAGLFTKLNDSQKEILENYLNLLNIKHLADRKIYQLSSGEQRQVFLARALVKNPPLLLLDEPCQGLDFNHIVYFRELVNELVVELNKTLIYVTHYTEEIPACVDKFLRLNAGRVS